MTRGWQGCEPDTGEEAERDRDKRGKKKERWKGGQEMGTVTGRQQKEIDGRRWGWRD